MRLSEYTDYSLRVLMYCAAQPSRLVTIAELAAHHTVSKNHLMKVVNDLARQGLLETVITDPSTSICSSFMDLIDDGQWVKWRAQCP